MFMISTKPNTSLHWIDTPICYTYTQDLLPTGEYNR